MSETLVEDLYKTENIAEIHDAIHDEVRNGEFRDFGIIPAVNRIRWLIEGSGCDPDIRTFLDHIEDVTRKRVKVHARERSTVLVAVPDSEATTIFDDAIDFLSESSCRQRM